MPGTVGCKIGRPSSVKNCLGDVVSSDVIAMEDALSSSTIYLPPDCVDLMTKYLSSFTSVTSTVCGLPLLVENTTFTK